MSVVDSLEGELSTYADLLIDLLVDDSIDQITSSFLAPLGGQEVFVCQTNQRILQWTIHSIKK